MRDVICNTSPLHYLHQVDLIHLLPKLFESVQTPPAVVAELAEGKRQKAEGFESICQSCRNFGGLQCDLCRIARCCLSL